MGIDFNGYMMKGVDGEHLLVVRAFNEEDILKILFEVQSMKSKKHRELAKRLLKDFYAGED